MKQILFLLVLVLVGYFVLWSGATRVLYNAGLNPQKLVTSVVTEIDEDFIPEIDPVRNGFKYTNANSFNKVKENVFITYDPSVCFALVDLAYSSGSAEAESLIRRYLTMFTLPEDSDKVLNLLKSYKDKQTLNILLSLYSKSKMPKAGILNVLASYHTPEVAQTIKNATSSKDYVLAQTARTLEETFKEHKWYKEGIEVDLNKKNNQSGRYEGTNFE